MFKKKSASAGADASPGLTAQPAQDPVDASLTWMRAQLQPAVDAHTYLGTPAAENALRAVMYPTGTPRPPQPGTEPPPSDLPPRTKVEIEQGAGVTKNVGAGDHVLIENQDFVYTGPDKMSESKDSCCGVFVLGPAASVTVRNCSFTGFRQGIIPQGYTAMIGELIVEDCEIYDTSEQGLYCSQVERIRVARTHYVDCGNPTILDHAIYIQYDCGDDVIVEDCIMVNSGSHAAQLRSGGIARRNFVARCPLGLQLGGGDAPVEGGVMGELSENVVCEGKDIDMPAGNRGMGLMLGNIVEAVVRDNLIWQNHGTGGVSVWLNGEGVGGEPGVGIHDVTGTGNRVLNWKWGTRTDGLVTGVTATDFGPEAAMPDTAPKLVLDTLLGSGWIEKVLSRELSAPAAIAAVQAAAPS